MTAGAGPPWERALHLAAARALRAGTAAHATHELLATAAQALAAPLAVLFEFADTQHGPHLLGLYDPEHRLRGGDIASAEIHAARASARACRWRRTEAPRWFEPEGLLDGWAVRLPASHAGAPVVFALYARLPLATLPKARFFHAVAAWLAAVQARPAPADEATAVPDGLIASGWLHRLNNRLGVIAMQADIGRLHARQREDKELEAVFEQIAAYCIQCSVEARLLDTGRGT
ncbi:hypothetical protein [Frateuria defendens]|uniref:hypothetical protein n=1 Tax=Frateuria defendens TaxID=2219559 RepID=UPI00066FCE2C|nr:hypothetical protein [Frateuria defendens]